MNIDNIKRRLLVKYPFFGSVVANISYEENNNIRTAGTDGKVIYYNSKFLSNLSFDEQLFIFAHEVCHVAFNHILRSKDKNQGIWNTATDAVINAFLKRDGLKMVDGGVDIDDAINYDAEEMYNKLLKEQQEQKSNTSCSNKSQNQNGDNQTKNQETGHDSHDMWKDAVVKEEASQNSSNNKNAQNSSKQSEINQKQEETKKMGEKESFNKNRKEYKKQLKDLKDTLIKESTKAGSMTNEDILNVSNIGYSRELIDWRYVLNEVVNFDYDWSYKNAAIENGVISANLEEISTPQTEIVLDTSGSIDENLFKNFLRECKNILKYSKLKVGCFDTKFYGFNVIRTEQDIENMKFVGGGGTDFNAAINAFSKRIENKIIFTDGYANMPKDKVNAIWIVFGRDKINPIGGTVIYITNEQLNKLRSRKTR